MKNRMLSIAIGACIIASAAQAAPTWGTVSWNEVTVSGAGYQDKHWHEDPTDNYNAAANPAVIDIIGNNTYTAAYWANDGQNLMFRVRVDGDPTVSQQFVWSAVLNTQGDATADFMMQLDLKTDNQVEMAVALGGNPGDTPKPWGNLNFEGPPTDNHVGPAGPGVAADWHEFVAAGSDIGDDPGPSGDYFVDFAFDLNSFYAVTGLNAGDAFQVVFASSADHISSTLDLPDYTGWSDPITVPEPTSMALLALGVTVLAMRRRKV